MQKVKMFCWNKVEARQILWKKYKRNWKTKALKVFGYSYFKNKTKTEQIYNFWSTLPNELPLYFIHFCNTYHIKHSSRFCWKLYSPLFVSLLVVSNLVIWAALCFVHFRSCLKGNQIVFHWWTIANGRKIVIWFSTCLWCRICIQTPTP